MGWIPYSHRFWIGKHLGPKLRNSRHNKTLILALDDQRFLLPWWTSVVCNDFEYLFKYYFITYTYF